MDQNVPKTVADLAAQTKKDVVFDKPVEGLDFDKDVTIDDILLSYAATGI